MSQYDFGLIDPLSKTGTELADDLSKWRDAVHTTHTGLTRPAYVKAGMLWMDSSLTPVITLYVFDGAVDIKVGDFNNVTHEGNFGSGGTGGGGATGGGDDKIFYLNDQNVTTDYTIPIGQNAMSAGAVTVDNGVVVAVPDGSTWTVV